MIVKMEEQYNKLQMLRYNYYILYYYDMIYGLLGIKTCYIETVTIILFIDS